MLFLEVTDDQRVSSGGGVKHEGELIEVIEMSIEDVKGYLDRKEVNCPTFTLYGLQWFLAKKANRF